MEERTLPHDARARAIAAAIASSQPRGPGPAAHAGSGGRAWPLPPASPSPQLPCPPDPSWPPAPGYEHCFTKPPMNWPGPLPRVNYKLRTPCAPGAATYPGCVKTCGGPNQPPCGGVQVECGNWDVLRIVGETRGRFVLYVQLQATAFELPPRAQEPSFGQYVPIYKYVPTGFMRFLLYAAPVGLDTAKTLDVTVASSLLGPSGPGQTYDIPHINFLGGGQVKVGTNAHFATLVGPSFTGIKLGSGGLAFAPGPGNKVPILTPPFDLQGFPLDGLPTVLTEPGDLFQAACLVGHEGLYTLGAGRYQEVPLPPWSPLDIVVRLDYCRAQAKQ